MTSISWLLVNVSTPSLTLVSKPRLQDDVLTTLSDLGGYSNFVSLSEYSSVLILSFLAIVSQRSYWQNQTYMLTDTEWQNILDKIQIAEREMMSNLAIGSFFWSVAILTDPNILVCTGQTVAQSDYPELTAVVPASWLSGANIQLPDLRETGFLGDSAISNLGGNIGANTHQLTIAEMPNHNHSQNPHSHTYTANIGTPTGAGPIVAGASIVVPTPSITGLATATNNATGGDGSHNNIQKSLQLIPYLIAR